MYQFEREAYEARMQWFREARFGLFLHWGLYAIPARGEWVRSNEQMPESEYLPFFDEFRGEDFAPRAWARAAKEAGMRYAVLTAKHHDGFCLFDSKLTDFKSTNTPCGRDIVREFLDAFRAEGLRVGLYFSVIDWHHPDFPHYGDRHHPMRNHPECSNEHRDFDRYLEYMHGQVRELCENYGKIDIFWFDFSYDDMRGEKWKGAQLADMVRSLQPGVILDNRLEVSGEGFGSLYECAPTPWHGDFVSPEKIIPPNGLQDVEGNDLCWEACVTMNHNWGYCAADHYYKPADLLIKKLVECVSKGGNLLLNVGPDAKGNFPPESLQRLQAIGKWMKFNHKSIYGCGKAGLEKPDYGRITRNGNRLYFHIYENTLGPLPLMGLRREQIQSIRWLATGAEIKISTSWVHSDYPEIVFADLGPDPVLPDPVDTVIEVTLREDAYTGKEIHIRWDTPVPFEEAIEALGGREIGLYYITRMYNKKETGLYLGESTYSIKHRLKAHRDWVYTYSHSKIYVRIGRAQASGGDIKEAIRHAEKALILDHSNVLCDNTASTKSYSYDELYRIYNEGDIFELKPIVDMKEHTEW